MKKLYITILALLLFKGYSQNRYSNVTPSTYTPETFEQMSVVPMAMKKKHDSNLEYLFAIKDWIVDLKTKIQIPSYNNQLEEIYNALTKLQSQGLANAYETLKETELYIKDKIIDSYNQEVNNQQTSSASQTTTTQSFIKSGLEQYKKGEFAKAISNFSKHLENDQNNTDVLFYRAMSKSEIGDNYGALNDYEKIIDLNSNYPIRVAKFATIYNNKAYTLVKLERYSEALPYVEKALKLDDSEWFIWDTRGEIYLKLGENQKSINDLNKALNIKENPNSYYLRGLANIALGNKEKGCKDLSKSGELGNEEAYKKIAEKCK